MAKIVIEVPERLAGLAVAFKEVVASVEARVASAGGGKAIDYAHVEEVMAEGAAHVERAANRAILQALDIDVPSVIIGGRRYTRVGRCEAPYHTMAGSVQVERSLYRASGARGGTPEGEVVDPVSMRAGVVGAGWLPGTARAMAHAVQLGTSREAATSARQNHRLPYARESFERVAHLVGALTVAAHKDIEDSLIEALEIPEEARSISVSLDRVSVPMEEPRKRPVGRPKKGAPKRPVEVKYREAYCGTVTLHDRNGEALHTIRYGCMPNGDAQGMVERLCWDAATLTSKRPDLETQLLCDGAHEMWKLLEEPFSLTGDLGKVHRLVDMHHLTEKLGAAAEVVYGQHGRDEAISRWKLRLINRSEAAMEILEELVDSGNDEGPGEQHFVHQAITYLENHAERMDYAKARRMGLPLGSGNVEATCKSLFAMRLKRCGARWKERSAEHIVQLRALALSDRWDDAIHLILRPLSHAVRAA